MVYQRPSVSAVFVLRLVWLSRCWCGLTCWWSSCASSWIVRISSTTLCRSSRSGSSSSGPRCSSGRVSQRRRSTVRRSLFALCVALVAQIGSQGSHWSWKVVKIYEIWLFIFQYLKSPEIGHGRWKSREKFLIFASVVLKNQDTESVIFPVTFVLNYWNCLCVSHKLNCFHFHILPAARVLVV